jgi:hypothetical protein
MNPLSTDKRRLAAALRENADGILHADRRQALQEDAFLQVMAIVGKVGAMVLEGDADILDAMWAQTVLDPLMEKRRALMEKNDAIRRAAATGDWSGFDKLSKQFVDEALRNAPATDGGGGAAG